MISTSVSSLTSSYSSASTLNKARKSKIKSNQRLMHTFYCNEDFETSNNGDELAEIDARLTKLKKFLNEHL